MSLMIRTVKIDCEPFCEHKLASLTGRYLLLLPGGKGRLRCDTGYYRIESNLVFLLPPDHAVSINWHGSGWLIAFKSEQLRAYFRYHPEERLLPIFQPGTRRFTAVFPATVTALQSLAELLYQEQLSPKSSKISAAYLFSILVNVATSYRITHKIPMGQQNYQLTEKLLQLVKEHYRVEKSPMYYAGQLGSTVRKLNTLARLTTGKTVTELISEKFLAEAEHLLAGRTLTIKEIAYELGFADMAQFNHFIRRYTGLSPTRYRQQLQRFMGIEEV